MRLYRVFPYNSSAAPDEEGGALFVPPQGDGRIDNPDLYDVLYLGDSPEGAIAEKFNRGDYRQRWTSDMLRPRGPHPRKRWPLILATYDISDVLLFCDLDHGQQLLDYKLRPSDVITRNRRRTQSWAATIFHTNVYAGIRWWSYHDARWGSIGLWEFKRLPPRKIGLEELTLEHRAVREAAEVLSIEVGSERRR